MCAIVASYNKDKLRELFELNSYRGETSYSLASFDISNIEINELQTGEGIMPGDTIDIAVPGYFVGHTQAPTAQTSGIHPARFQRFNTFAFMWHNGIVKQKEIAEGEWDTLWMTREIVNRGWDFLSTVEGTFACIFYRKETGLYSNRPYDITNTLYVFRNEISPLFIDTDLNISSTKFENSHSLPPNTIFKLNLTSHIIEDVSRFTTKENPYYFGAANV